MIHKQTKLNFLIAIIRTTLFNRETVHLPNQIHRERKLDLIFKVKLKFWKMIWILNYQMLISQSCLMNHRIRIRMLKKIFQIHLIQIVF